MRSIVIQLGAMGVLAAIAGCMALGDAGESRSGLVEEVQTPDDADRFVTIAPDPRRCAPPVCGGYFVRAVNLDTPEEHVTKLLFDGSGLDEETIAKVREALLPELVLLGHFGEREETYRTRPFVVVDAYRGLPGKL